MVDPAPFPNYRGWRFGLREEKFKEVPIELVVDQTDSDGHSKLSGTIEKAPDSTRPLRASIKVSILEPGGRSTNTDITLPVRTKPLFIGLHERFRDNRIEEDTEAAFDIAAVDAEGKPIAREGLHYALVREGSEYHWDRGDRQDRYHRAPHEIPGPTRTL